MEKILGFIYLLLGQITILMAEIQQPNIVFILTDDQDLNLGGMTPMVKTKKLIGDAGITFTNMFVTTPLCCPSRSSILTGKYVHNHAAINNSVSGNCSSTTWQKKQETQTFATFLKKSNYETFFAGKYLNQYGKNSVGGVSHVPPGWDHWAGLVRNSKYYNYTLSVNGKAEVHGDRYSQDYLTDVIQSKAVSFLQNRRTLKADQQAGLAWNKWDRNTNNLTLVKMKQEKMMHKASADQPFLMMLSVPACHAPFTPAPQYSKIFANTSAPRTPSFNVLGKDKHWLLRQATCPMTNESINYIDKTFRNRWRTLLSVDDLVENVINTLAKTNQLDNTYIFFSSDNGFHLGQFSMPNDKRHLYEFDIQVPLMVRGPGIKPGQKRHEPVLNIDFAPTFIDISGQIVPNSMDGTSLKPLLDTSSATVPTWRTDFMVEYVGEYKKTNPGCPQYDNQGLSQCYPSCVCEDAANNTYACLRVLSKTDNLIYCQFADAEDFVEIYDLKSDAHQLTNLHESLDPKQQVSLSQRLIKLSVCNGPSCKSTNSNPLHPNLNLGNIHQQK